MYPTEFKEQTVIFGKDQPQYLPLPAHVSADGMEVTSCWRMNWKERIRALVTGRIYFTVLSFGESPQPQIAKTTPP